MTPESKEFFVKLPARGLVQIEGEDRYGFLQGLVSNDVELLKTQPCVYACLLTPQGKFLHDFFMNEIDGVIFLECEGGDRAQDLYKRLNMYRLRSKVQISVEEDITVYSVTGANPQPGYPDPRHEHMGWRTLEKPQAMEEQNFDEWDMHRIRLGIPDGSRDMDIDKSTLLECHIDKFRGISFEKGCYVGQELTARMNYRGLAKKHLYPVEILGGPVPDHNDVIHVDGKMAGEMKSSCGHIGMALLKGDMVAALENSPIKLLE